MLREWLRDSRLTWEHFVQLRKSRAPYVFLDKRWEHHGKHSGYLIGEGIGPSLPRHDRIFPRPFHRLISRVNGDDAWEDKLLLHAIQKFARTKVLHLVDGDFDTWAYRTRPHWVKTKITATFHQTPDKLLEIVPTLRAGMLDGIVCVSRIQLPLVEHLAPPGRCVFIPHGVDVDFFSEEPASVDGRSPLLLAVGSHRRDFKTLRAAASIIKARRPDARVLLIAPRQHIEHLPQDEIVETASDLSDVQLRAAYREARMLFLPLETATANNALLESMATGRPSVITDLPAIRDYASDRAAILCPFGDVHAHAEAALKLLNDTAFCAEMGRTARKEAVHFSWQHVRRAFLEFLVSVAGDGTRPSNDSAAGWDYVQ
jgi:glycosyltransferase involved in cell wall biosynthesis